MVGTERKPQEARDAQANSGRRVGRTCFFASLWIVAAAEAGETADEPFTGGRKGRGVVAWGGGWGEESKVHCLIQSRLYSGPPSEFHFPVA